MALRTTSQARPAPRHERVAGPGGHAALSKGDDIAGHRPATDLDGDHRQWDADAAVSHLYAAHWTSLLRLATMLTGDRATGEDVLQDAFVALHGRWRRIGEPATALAYLRTSVVNGARSVARHRAVEFKYRSPAPPSPAGPEEHALRAVQDARVLAALRTLPQRQQEVLVLRYYADLSEEQIATTLGISRGAVKSYAHRAMSTLRDRLDGGTPEGTVTS
jgi:RNA polymerase sigma-70 factor (sigma-E family)